MRRHPRLDRPRAARPRNRRHPAQLRLMNTLSILPEDEPMGPPLQSGRTTASMRFIGLLAAVIMTAAGCGSPAGHGHPALTAGTTAAGWPDPCTAVPATDVVRITHLAAAATITRHGRGLCEYGAADSGN